MATIHLPMISKLLVLAVFICCCCAANVQFFWEHDFKGTVYEATSSTSCKTLPNGFEKLNGSIKTTGCIAVFHQAKCEKDKSWASLIKSEESRLSELIWKYEDKKLNWFTVSSYRDCTDMERRPQVDFDLFREDYLKGEVEQYRDMCSCTNLRYDGTTWKDRSSRFYGDCFKMYYNKNCEVEPRYTRHYTGYHYVGGYYQSIEPCHPPQAQCAVRFSASIFRVQLKTEFSAIETAISKVPIEVFVNNGTSTIERYVEYNEEITETLHFELFNATHLLTAITFENGVIQELRQTVPNHLQHQSLSGLQTFEYNGTVVSKRELRIREKLTLPPCTKLEVIWLAEIAQIEKDYEVHLKITAAIQEIKRMSAKFIPHYFEDLNFLTKQDNFSSVAKTDAKLSMNYVATTRLNVTTEPIAECRKRLIRLKAIVTNVTAITNTSNLTQVLQTFPMNNTQIFINNGTTQQEKLYEAAMEVTEIGEFMFSSELNKMSFVEFHNNLQIDEKPSISFLKNAWENLKIGKMTREQNEIIPDEPYKYTMLSNNTYRVEEKLAVSPCTEYKVSSFVEIAKNVEIEYKIQLQVTGLLGSDSVDAEEIRENLKDLQFIANEDNVTVVVESTGKLILNYVVGTGVDAEGTPLRECYERHAEFVSNFNFVCSG